MKKNAFRVALVVSYFLMSVVCFRIGLLGLYTPQLGNVEIPTHEETEANQSLEKEIELSKQKSRSNKNANKIYRPTPTPKPTPTLESTIATYGGFSLSAITAICAVVTVFLTLVQINLARKSRFRGN